MRSCRGAGLNPPGLLTCLLGPLFAAPLFVANACVPRFVQPARDEPRAEVTLQLRPLVAPRGAALLTYQLSIDDQRLSVAANDLTVTKPSTSFRVAPGAHHFVFTTELYRYVSEYRTVQAAPTPLSEADMILAPQPTTGARTTEFFMAPELMGACSAEIQAHAQSGDRLVIEYELQADHPCVATCSRFADVAHGETASEPCR